MWLMNLAQVWSHGGTIDVPTAVVTCVLYLLPILILCPGIYHLNKMSILPSIVLVCVYMQNYICTFPLNSTPLALGYTGWWASTCPCIVHILSLLHRCVQCAPNWSYDYHTSFRPSARSRQHWRQLWANRKWRYTWIRSWSTSVCAIV